MKSRPWWYFTAEDQCIKFTYGTAPNQFESDDFGALINMITNGILETRYKRMKDANPTAPATKQNITRIGGWTINYPVESYQVSGATLGARVGLCVLFMFVTLLPYPWMVSSLLAERENKLFHMLRIAGTTAINYWFEAYLFQFVVYFIWGTVFCVFAWAAGSWAFVAAGVEYYILTVSVIWSHAMIGITLFITSLLQTQRSGVQISFAVMIVSIALAAVFGFAIEEGTRWTFGILWFPPLAYARSLLVLFRYGPASMFRSGTELSACLGMMFGFGSIFFIAGVYLNLARYDRRLRGGCCSTPQSQAQSGKVVLSNADAAIAAAEDVDVANERARVASPDGKYAVRIVRVDRLPLSSPSHEGTDLTSLYVLCCCA